jgi:hypothetical protein|tara:strand:+ start:10767 stop:11261 length:495 start_codon:yes stop_codon:yes gene_type:complete
VRLRSCHQTLSHKFAKERYCLKIIVLIRGLTHTKANAKEPNMGLETWKNSPGRILKSDVVIAKNYLQEDEIKKLERTVTGFFDYIEGVIDRKKTFTMQEFAQSVDKFLTFNEYEILEGKGRVSSGRAKEKAVSEYEEFNKHQVIESDFEKESRRILEKGKEEEK